jgi:hypothetical protein
MARDGSAHDNPMGRRLLRLAQTGLKWWGASVCVASIKSSHAEDPS